MNTAYGVELVSDIARAGKPLTDGDNQELFAAARTGDKVVSRRMVEGNLLLVVSIVDHFIGLAPQIAYLRDDMTSAGFTGLVKGVKKIGRVKQAEKVTSYLSVSIRHDIRRFLSNETTIYVPQRSQQAARIQGNDIEPPVVVNGLPDMRRVDASYGEEEVDVRDVFDSCCICEEERVLLRMREGKYAWKEIAAAVNRPLGSMTAMRNSLEERIVQKLKSLR